MPELTIKEVCAQAVVTPRTVHFYIQQGLLPPPEGAGRGARYSDAHLARLRLIRRLQKEHLPLNEIRRQLASMADDQVVQALAGGRPAAGRAKNSALDYIHSVKSSAVNIRRPLQASRPTMDAVASLNPDWATGSPGAPTRRSQWERIVLNEDLELHIRRPLSRERNRFVEKLLAYAKHIANEEHS